MDFLNSREGTHSALCRYFAFSLMHKPIRLLDFVKLNTFYFVLNQTRAILVELILVLQLYHMRNVCHLP